MENKEQLKLLAKTALQAQNYSQAYEYYSKLLESDLNDINVWIGKGISAAYLSNLDESRMLEAVTYIKNALEISKLSESEKVNLSKELIELAELKIKDGILQIDKEINKRFNEIQMGTYTAKPLHDLNKLSITSEVGREFRAALTSNFDLIEIAYKITPTKENIKKIVDNLNFVFIHSNKNQGYFGALNDLTEPNKRINKIWNDAELELKKIDPNIKLENYSPVVNDKGGCFIATATTGDYNHPVVLHLRDFRDSKLQNSPLGKRFIKFYYKNSPPIANYIKDKSILKKMTYYLFIKPISVLVSYFNK